MRDDRFEGISFAAGTYLVEAQEEPTPEGAVLLVESTPDKKANFLIRGTVVTGGKPEYGDYPFGIGDVVYFDRYRDYRAPLGNTQVRLRGKDYYLINGDDVLIWDNTKRDEG